MSQSNLDQDLDKPLICQNDDDIDVYISGITTCKFFNRMIYEHNKPHNRIGNIILQKLPDNIIYKFFDSCIILFVVLLLIPLLGIILMIVGIVFQCSILSKYSDVKNQVRKPWKNMLKIKDIEIGFLFATFTMKNLHHLYDNPLLGIPENEKDKLYELVKKELFERPAITVCSPKITSTYKYNRLSVIILIVKFFCFGFVIQVLDIVAILIKTRTI
jgi:hypothetical protein